MLNQDIGSQVFIDERVALAEANGKSSYIVYDTRKPRYLLMVSHSNLNFGGLLNVTPKVISAPLLKPEKRKRVKLTAKIKAVVGDIVGIVRPSVKGQKNNAKKQSGFQ